MIDFDDEEVSAGIATHGSIPSSERRPPMSFVELRPPPPLPARGAPSFDVTVHPADMLVLALESILARFPAEMDFREPMPERHDENGISSASSSPLRTK